MNPSEKDIREWIVARVSALTGVDAGEIDVAAPVRRFGLDSVALITLASDLEKWLGYRFRANPLDDHPTIDSLSHFLAAEVAGKPPR